MEPLAPALLRILRSAVVLRYGVIFLLGVCSSLFLAPFRLALWWSQPLFAVLALLVAVGVNELRLGRRGVGLVLALLIVGGLGGLILWFDSLVEAAGPAVVAVNSGTAILAAGLAALLIPILVGIVAALIARQPKVFRSLTAALVGWLGAAIAITVETYIIHVLNATVLDTPPSTTIASIIVIDLVGFFFALLGGLLGWGLHRLIARRDERSQ